MGAARSHPEPAQGPVHRDESQPGRLDGQAQDAEVLRGLRRADRPLAGNRPRQGVAGRRRQTRAADHGQALRTELPAVVRILLKCNRLKRHSRCAPLPLVGRGWGWGWGWGWQLADTAPETTTTPLPS